jgi:Trypsin
MRTTRRVLGLPFLFALVCALLTVAPVGAITGPRVRDNANTYSNVGGMIGFRPSIQAYGPRCTVTLIAPTVVLTASHCTAIFQDGDQAYVSFEPEIVPTDAPTTANRPRWIAATPVVNAGYNQSQSDSGDIGVLILNRPAAELYPNIPMATLPPAGLLSQLAAKNGLKDQRFLAAGYGVNDRVNGGGQPSFSDDDWRWYVYSEFNALNGGYIRLSQNPALGNGGTCFGDSGGPNFLTTGGKTYLAAVTVTGDSVCRSTNVDYRTDTVSARAFLAYVETTYGVTIPSLHQP